MAFKKKIVEKKAEKKAEKKEEKKPEKVIVKKIEKNQKYVRIDRVAKAKKEGWVEVKENTNKKLGIKTSALGKAEVDNNSSDLVLMEKN